MQEAKSGKALILPLFSLPPIEQLVGRRSGGPAQTWGSGGHLTLEGAPHKRLLQFCGPRGLRAGTGESLGAEEHWVLSRSRASVFQVTPRLRRSCSKCLRMPLQLASIYSHSGWKYSYEWQHGWAGGLSPWLQLPEEPTMSWQAP